MKRSILLFVCALATVPALQGAEQQVSAEAKLREGLRNVTLQLREVTAERDTLKATQAALESEKQALQEKLDAAIKQSAEDKVASEKTVTDMETKVASQATEIARLNESLAKWKASQAEAVALAQKKETARAQLASEKIVRQRRIDDQQMKNAEMYKIGIEILTRYERFGLGTAITAREPFVGTTRVKLQNLVQDYGDKLADQRITPQTSPVSR